LLNASWFMPEPDGEQQHLFLGDAHGTLEKRLMY
jgi:hypothetical protein